VPLLFVSLIPNQPVKKITLLFVCIHNSARSQMAEAFLNHLAGDRFEAASAGLEKGTLNPLAVRVMAEVGIDISGNQTKSVFDFHESGKHFHYVITVCDAAHAASCPVFPGANNTLHWFFDDPSSLAGTEEEKLEATRIIRDAIETQVRRFIESVGQHAH